MRRRDLIQVAATAAAWPACLAAQQNALPVVGLLHGESPERFAAFHRVFMHGLNEAGFAEAKNVVFEYRWAEGRNERLLSLAEDLVSRNVTVIAAPGSTPAALAAKKATDTIPIVIFTAGDPVALGLVAGLSRPGGNVTGATSLGGDLAPKRLELLRELIPAARRMALLVNPTNPALTEATAKAAREAAAVLGVELEVVRAGAEAEFEPVLAALAERRVDGLVIAIDSFFTARREKLGQLALRHQIPAIYQYPDFAAAGGIMSYGGALDGYYLAGRYTGRILKGERPDDLPVQQVTKLELVLNLKVAKALGLTIPPALLARADQVID